MDEIVEEPKRDPRWKNVKAWTRTYSEDDKSEDLRGLTLFAIQVYAEEHVFTIQQSAATRALDAFPSMYGIILDQMVAGLDMHIRGEAASNDENSCCSGHG